MSKHLVLVVDDDVKGQQLFAELVEELLSDQIELLQAYDLETAKEIFEQRQDEFAAIVMDACVPGSEVNSHRLVWYMRRTYEGPIIAISTEVSYRNQLTEAGCSHQCEKDQVFPAKITEILNLD